MPLLIGLELPAHELVASVEAGATYVFDLGYYDYAWWAKLDAAACRIVTQLKRNTPLTVIHEQTVPAGSNILPDRIGHLPARQANSRKNPFQKEIRELQVVIGSGKVLRIVTNDLTAPAQVIADLYRRRWAIELFFRWVSRPSKSLPVGSAPRGGRGNLSRGPVVSLRAW